MPTRSGWRCRVQSCPQSDGKLAEQAGHERVSLRFTPMALLAKTQSLADNLSVKLRHELLVQVHSQTRTFGDLEEAILGLEVLLDHLLVHVL